jgi:hypothetical protein
LVHTPFFSGPAYGNSMLGAAVTLAIMIPRCQVLLRYWRVRSLVH